ncbi:glycoside hydrolase, catalytic domain-containing protein [Tanacetum coccineum]
MRVYVQKMTSATQEEPSEIDTFYRLHTVNGVFQDPEALRMYDRMRELEATGEHTTAEINAMVRGGKLRGHIPGVGPVMPGYVRSRLSYTAPVDRSRDVDFMMSLMRSDNRFADAFARYDSGGASGSGGSRARDREDGDDTGGEDGGDDTIVIFSGKKSGNAAVQAVYKKNCRLFPSDMSLGKILPPWHQFLDQKIRGAHFSLGIVAGERFAIELTPSTFPQRHFAGDMFPQRHVAGEKVGMLLGKASNVVRDIELMDSLGIKAYRFSISWSRILPRGRFGEVNPAGIMFYNNLIDNLILKGIEPFVTIHHIDLPQELEDRFGAWLNPEMQEEFLYFAEICFKSFGDRVKHWITMNEPKFFVDLAYGLGMIPPSRCSEPFGICLEGNSDGSDPAIFGDYPEEIKEYLGSELPSFSLDEKSFMKSSIDFIGINHYSTTYAKDCTNTSCSAIGNRASQGFVDTVGERDGVLIGEPTGAEGSYVVPRGMGEIVNLIKIRYNNTPMFVTENGYSSPNVQEQRFNELLNDTKRVEYHTSYLSSLLKSIRGGADVRGYFAWSLMDGYEWLSGYNVRYGLYYVDRQTLTRTPKLSARWYNNFLTNKMGMVVTAAAVEDDLEARWRRDDE